MQQLLVGMEYDKSFFIFFLLRFQIVTIIGTFGRSYSHLYLFKRLAQFLGMKSAVEKQIEPLNKTNTSTFILIALNVIEQR